MSAETVFEEINEAKASMEHIYDQPDPRAYFQELRKLGYVIPDASKPIFQALIAHLQKVRSGTIDILDIGCSYGVNAALLKHDLSMRELNEHWTQQAPAAAAHESIITRDRRFFDGLAVQEDITVTGLDQAAAAIGFGKGTGLLDEGLAVNLEIEALTPADVEHLAQTDLVISTGCVGYVTEKSFKRLLPAVTKWHQPWFGNFVLRMFPFDIIAMTLKDWGYVTEKLEGRTFVQRRFASSDEEAQVLEQLHRNGIDSDGQESEGSLLAEFYLSRPAADAAAYPLERLLAAN